MIDYSLVSSLSSSYPRCPSVSSYSYGTSGFRGPAETLRSVFIRMGFLTALRAISMGKADHIPELFKQASNAGSSDSLRFSPVLGVMITASHNEAGDNGIKIVDSSGEMLAESWEADATEISNRSESEVESFIRGLVDRLGLDTAIRPLIVVGHDTRRSSVEFSYRFDQAARAMGALVHQFGLVSTPELHWLVRDLNSGGSGDPKRYFNSLTNGFLTALKFARQVKSEKAKENGEILAFEPDSDVSIDPILLDCANGVGARSVASIARSLSSSLVIHIRNAGDRTLNEGCGAEFVQKSREFPGFLTGFTESPDFSLLENLKLASFDGDADRLIYFYSEEKNLKLLDGDKMIALIAIALTDAIKRAALFNHLTIGIVQTAYANGASTIFLEKSLGIPVNFTPTGVKFLHHKAKLFDIGIYFEANGHGTVLFSEKAKNSIAKAASEGNSAANLLNSLVELINPTVGDALSDLLFLEVALYYQGWNLQQWNSLYSDLPSSMIKVQVPNRNEIKTTDAERKCVQPVGLQSVIDSLVAEGNEGGERRAFVRPSGTEDCVRVYAEAPTIEDAKKLAKQIGEAVEVAVR